MVRKMGSSNLHRLLFTSEKKFSMLLPTSYIWKLMISIPLKQGVQVQPWPEACLARDPQKVGICLQPKPYKVGPHQLEVGAHNSTSWNNPSKPIQKARFFRDGGKKTQQWEMTEASTTSTTTKHRNVTNTSRVPRSEKTKHKKHVA